MPYDAILREARTLTKDERVSLIAALSSSLDDAQEAPNDCRDTYPDGFFDLFGSDPCFPVEPPAEIPWEYDAKREFL